MLRGSIEPGSNLYVGTYIFHQVCAPFSGVYSRPKGLSTAFVAFRCLHYKCISVITLFSKHQGNTLAHIATCVLAHFTDT